MADDIAVDATRPGTKPLPRGLHLALFIACMAWAAAAAIIAGSAAQGIALRLQFGMLEPLLEAIFLLFLLVLGFRLLDTISSRARHHAEVLALPRRTGWPAEWLTGAAVGWAVCLAAVLPIVLSGHLHAHFNRQLSTALALPLSLATVLVATLAQEVIFRGYPFQRLIVALGPSSAALVLSALYGATLAYARPVGHPLIAWLDGTLFALLLAIAWFRTHALWCGWGAHFAYRAVAAILLGLPLEGHGEFGSLIDSYTSGPAWLTGGAYGIDASFLTVFAMVAGIAVLYRVTRDYAWNYTHRPIESAGYEVTVAPPAAHVAMEKAAAPPPLVQILPTTPQSRSVEPPPRT